jgi:hypothetical protein
MKKNTIHIPAAALGLLLLSVVSCKKAFIEIVPKGRVIAEAVADYDLLFNNLDLINMNTANAQIFLGDEIAAVDPYFTTSDLKTKRLFQWEGDIYEQAEDGGEMSTPMRGLYIYNKIINEMPVATGGTEEQKKSLVAEARAGRAWVNFMMINYYGKPYNEATSATDPGFPIITAADITEMEFKRATVKEMYDVIIDDLKKAIPDLPAVTWHRSRMSKGAAEGLLGKVYVFMGKYAEAIPYLDAALADIATSTLPVRLYNYQTELTATTYPTVVNDFEVVYARQAVNSWSSTYNEIVISPQTAALFDASDYRLRFYSATTSGNAAYPAGVKRRMRVGQMRVGVVVPDLYLLRAESKCRTNDLAGAVTDLENFRKTRMPAANATVAPAIAGDAFALLQFIMEERIREFAVFGYRWFDMRRLSVDPLFGQKTFTHTLYSASGTPTVFTSTPERLVLKFPRKVMDFNPGLENNP